MLDRIVHSLGAPIAGFAAALALTLAFPAAGQAPPPPQAAQFDPSDVYFQGYLAVRGSEQLESTGDFIGALEKLEKANGLFGAVRKFYPEWKPEMVGGRAEKTMETIGRVRPKAEEQQQKNRNVVAELEGGTRKSGRVIDPAAGVTPLTPGVLEVDPLATRRLAEAEAEVKRLRKLNEKASAVAGDTSRMRDLERQRDALQAQLRAAQTNENSRDQSRLLDLARQRDALQAQLRAAETNAESRNVSRLQDLERQRNTLQAQLQAAQANQANEESREKTHRLDLERQLNALQAQLRAAETNAESRNVSRLQDLERQRNTLQAQLQAAQANQANEESREKTHRLDLERQLNALQAQLQAAETNAESRNISRLHDVQKQRDTLQSQLRAAETNVESLRARLAAAPMEHEMKGLNQRIETLEQEREAMAMALTQSRSAHTEAMARTATLEADLMVMRQQRADLDRDLKSERQVANSVVAGQRRQLDSLEKELQKKNTELTKANERINGLMSELQESREAFGQLRSERDSLLQERDQMAALLKLNEGGRIQDLIEQNMSLAKNLREANEKVSRMNLESNADKDATIDALRDLAIAKSQINRLHQDKREQEKRLADLETRLKNEEQALTQGQVAADPAEVEILRDIIKRQLRVQERRRQARDLLIEAARELGAKDERLAQAIDLFDAQEIALTPEEQKLIADRQVDGEFVSPFARDRATVGQATTELNRDISVFERTAEKSFVAGRLLPTRELFQMILDQHPGHTPSLCKLGIVHLKLDDTNAAVDTFRRAVELDANNPYAFRMLGFSLMKSGDLPAAEQSARRSVDLAPNDAKSQMLLATLCYRLGRTSEAESHFKAAITADPLPSEPYYNLALLYSRDGRRDDARDLYQKALERGALPDARLEERLNQP